MQKTIMAIASGAALVLGIYLGFGQHTETDYPLTGLQFETPQGASLDLGSLKGKVSVINFWATWCPPCVEEMPELDELYTTELKPEGIEMIGIAIDSPSAVKTFLEKTSVQYPILMAGFGGTELAKDLGNDQGGLPFTVILSEDGNVLLKKAGRIQMESIRNALKSHP